MPSKKLIHVPKLLPFFDLPNEIPDTFAQALRWLTNPKPGETHAEEMVRLERISVLSQMIRDRWNSKFRSFEKDKENRKYDKIKSELFNRVLNLTQEIHLIGSNGDRKPAFWFALVISELQIDALNPRTCDQFGELYQPTTKIKCRELIQNQNRQIKNLENPFSAKYFPHTYNFLEQARLIAGGDNDNFRKNYYTPFRQARESLATYLIEEGLVFKKSETGFQARQQERKIKPSP